MESNREAFKSGRCPKCGSENLEKRGNIANTGFLNGAGYFLDFPFGSNYQCHNCGAKNEESCFVATAVYGDQNAPEVQVLRKIRDNVLRRSICGRKFVEFYYSGAGKAAARFIREKIPSTIPFIKKGLDFVVESYSSSNNESD